MKRLGLFFLSLFLIAGPMAAQHRPLDAAQLHLAMKKLAVVGSALYVAAHPDDENTAMLAWLANDRLVRAGYLSVTRGDGGQNLIGEEKGELLGLIRTHELLAARNIDSAEQMFTRALDFGYSKTPAETLALWGHDIVLADVVWAIRKFQPDVIITRFPTTGEGGHGHHTASAMLAVEAFKLAADPTKFPEQMKYVTPWQPRRIFWNRFSFRGLDPNSPELANDVRVDLGKFNTLLGRAYTEIAAESRSMHKSQGFGSAERRGTIPNFLKQLEGDPAKGDIFEGIDTSWARYAGGEAVGKIFAEAASAFDPQNPQKSIPALLHAWEALDRLGADERWSPRSNPWIEIKRQELLEVIRGCAGLSIDVAAVDSSVVQGGEIPISVTVVNRSDYPFTLATVAARYANPGKAPGTALKNNIPVKTEISIKLPPDFPLSQPYWLKDAPTKGAFTVNDQALIGLPKNPPSIPIIVAIDDGRMHTLVFTVPALYRWTDPVKGEQTRPVDVVPEATANPLARVVVFPDTKPRSVSMWLRNFGDAGPVTVRLQAPAGWKTDPVSMPVTFAGKGDEARVTFIVTPPATQSVQNIQAELELATNKKVSMGVTNVDHPHIPAQRVFADAAARVVRVDVKKVGERIGYIMGSGDEVPDALRQIGYEVTLLTDADLDRGDFSRFDAVVTGVRAYNTRKRLKVAHARLLEYVKKGGTLILQYNTSDELAVSELGPYPFKISRDRVTVEEAPVKLTAHPLLQTPNKITEADFKDWVQERGLYFTGEADARYQTMLTSNDPGEPEKSGGQLYTRLGKGVFIYTSYAWWRQLPAGVPGAYRLFANLVSAR